MTKITELAFSITELAEYSCRSGDLELLSQSGPTAQEGIEGHQKLQHKRRLADPNYHAEYAIELNMEYQSVALTIRGRADGVIFISDKPLDGPKLVSNDPIRDALPVLVEEIKTTYVAKENLSQSAISLHIGQLKLYAFLLCENFELSNITGRLTWLRLTDQSTSEETFVWDFATLQTHFNQALDRYMQWRLEVLEHRQQVVAFASRLNFPFADFRPHQRALCAQVYRTVREHATLVFEAPTGVGKTISTVFPALKALGNNYAEQVVFVTAKQSGRKTLLDTCDLLNQQAETQNQRFKTLTLCAKDSICFCAKNDSSAFIEQVDEQSGKVKTICRYRHQFFDKLAGAMAACFKLDRIGESEIVALAEEFEICPFSFSLVMLPWLDLVVLDANYLFDPLVRLAHFENKADRISILVDESHNLVDRSREMYSAELSESLALQVLGATEHRALFSRLVNRLSESLIAIEATASSDSTAASQDWQVVALTTDQLRQLQSHVARIQAELLDFSQEQPLSPEEYSWLKQLIRFNVMLQLAGDAHRLFLRSESFGLIETLTLKYYCLNASDYLAPIIKNWRSATFFSGTLRPAEYIRRTIGLDPEQAIKVVPSLFSAQQLGVFISRQIDTRYRQRNAYLSAIVHDIFATISAENGNYLVAFSSYQLLAMVAEQFRAEYPEVALHQQTRDMSTAERDSFVARFFSSQGVVGFVILGGVFTEGIDYKGDALKGVVIVGSGMPQVNPFQQQLLDYYQRQRMDGFAMTYRYPAMQRVLQTAGRVIRQLSDTGVVVLLDKRFGQSEYTHLLPDYWQPQGYQDAAELSANLTLFWQAAKSANADDL